MSRVKRGMKCLCQLAHMRVDVQERKAADSACNRSSQHNAQGMSVLMKSRTKNPQDASEHCAASTPPHCHILQATPHPLCTSKHMDQLLRLAPPALLHCVCRIRPRRQAERPPLPPMLLHTAAAFRRPAQKYCLLSLIVRSCLSLRNLLTTHATPHRHNSPTTIQPTPHLIHQTTTAAKQSTTPASTTVPARRTRAPIRAVPTTTVPPCPTKGATRGDGGPTPTHTAATTA